MFLEVCENTAGPAADARSALYDLMPDVSVGDAPRSPPWLYSR